MKKDHLRAVLVGCGGISNAWLEANRNIAQLEIVGLVDINAAAAEAQKAKYDLNQAATGAEMEKVIEQTLPDLVFDCTIPDAHQHVAVIAMQMGCDVLGEKPLASSLAGARAIVAAMKSTGQAHAVMQNRRYLAGARRMQTYLRSGEIGHLTTLNADFYLGAHFGGFRDRMEHVLLLDMAIHTIDLGRMLVNANPVSVYCKEWNPQDSWYDHDASAVAIFTFDNGVVYTYRGSWCAEGMNTLWESDWRAIGTRGSVVWDGGEQFAIQCVKSSGGFISELDNRDMPAVAEGAVLGGHEGQIRAFVQARLNGETPETISTDNFKSLAMVFGAIESAEKDCPVQIETLD